MTARRYRSFLLAALLAAPLPAVAPAPARGGEVLGYREALSRALRKNPSVTASERAAEAAARGADVARGHYLPTLSFEERFSRTSAPAEVFGLKMNQQALSASDFADVDRFNDPAPRSGFTGSLSLSQPILAPSVLVGMGMAGREAGAARLDLSRRKEEALLSALSAWLDVLTGKEFASVAHRGVKDAREHLRVAMVSEEAGTGLASDVLRAKVFVARAEGELLSASTRVELARRALGLATGEGVTGALDAAGELPSFPPAGTAEERIAAAKRHRADLAALDGRVANAAANVALRRSAYLPTLGFQAGYQVDDEGDPFSRAHESWRAGVALSWTIFDGMRREGEVARASAEAARAREYRRGADDGAAFEVSRAWLALQDASSRLSIAVSAAESAEEGVRLLKERYENHLARMVDLLDAQTALDGARADRVRAENDLRHARAELEFASGTLLLWARGEGIGTEGAGPGASPGTQGGAAAERSAR